MRRAWVVILVAFGCGQPTPPHEGKSVEQLRRMLGDADVRVQAQGALGLSLHGAEARGAVGRLTELLDSGDGLVRRQSALALGKIGPEARPAVLSLMKLLQHEDWATRRQAAVALGEIGDPAAKAALEKGKADKNALVQKAVRAALERLGGEKKK